MAIIPVIDLTTFRTGGPDARAAIAVELGRACHEIGFFCVAGHGVPKAAIEGLRESMVAFFALPEAEKRGMSIRPGDYRGYIPCATFSPNAGSARPDLYEGFKIQSETVESDRAHRTNPLSGANRWPHRPDGFPTAVMAYWRAVDGLAEQLLRAFAMALGLGERAFLPSFKVPLTNMTLLHYPPMERGQNGYGIHPHKDSDAFTVLYPDAAGGLEVRRRDGGWIDVDCPDGAFVVNIGDMMELWSGGRFVSTPHRVVNRSGAERYSFPYFATPSYDTVITPAVTPVEGFSRPPLHVGQLTAEVFRTNWRDTAPRDSDLDLGTLSD